MSADAPEQPKPQGSLSARTAGAGLWTVSSRFAGKLMDLVSLVLLARALTPEQFGVVAIGLTLVLTVEAILDLPITAVLVREQTPTPNMYRTAFTLSVLRSLAIALMAVLVAVPLSQLYSEPRLAAIILVLALSPIARGLMSPRIVDWMRRFEFRPIVFMEVGGKIISLATVVSFIYLDMGYWAIVVASVANSTSMLLLSYVIAPFAPRFSLSELRRFAATFSWSTLTQVLSVLNWQLDRYVLPRFVGLATFGRYATASDLLAVPIQVMVQAAAGPLLSAYSSVSDRAALAGAALKTFGIGFFVIGGIYVGLACAAAPTLELIMGEHWRSAAPFLAGLAIASLGRLPTIPLHPLAMRLDRAHLLTLQILVELTVKAPIMIVATMTYGVWGAIGTIAVSSAVNLFVYMGLLKRMVGLTFRAQLLALVPSTVGLMVLAAVLLPMMPFVDAADGFVMTVLRLAAACGLAGLAHVAATFLVWALMGRPDTVERTLIDRGAEVLRRGFQRAA